MLYLTKGKKGAPFTGLYLEDLKNETLEVFFFFFLDSFIFRCTSAEDVYATSSP